MTQDDEIAAVKFNATRNAIYHVARRNFFDSLNRKLNFLVIVLGAGVAGKAAHLFQFDELWLEFSVLIVATAQLSFDFSNRARSHEFLQVKYYELLADLETDPAPDSKKLNSKMNTIAASEPMPMRAVDALAYNAVVDATCADIEYRKANRVYVPRYQLLLKNFIAFDGYEYRLARDHVWWGAAYWSRIRSSYGKEDDQKN